MGKKGEEGMKLGIDLTTCYIKNPSFVSRKIAEEYILVPIQQKASDIDCIYTLNEVGGRIWDLVDGERTVEQIRDTIVQEYEVCVEEAVTDIIELFQQLSEVNAVIIGK